MEHQTTKSEQILNYYKLYQGTAEYIVKLMSVPKGEIVV